MAELWVPYGSELTFPFGRLMRSREAKEHFRIFKFLVPRGTTAENPTLTRAEHLRVVEITLEETRRRVPVLAGCGGFNTADVHQLRRLCGRRHYGRLARADRQLCPDRQELPHLAGSQLGGVLEPVGALPVIIEGDVLIGGNCGVYEGTVVKQRAVLGTGTILNRSTPVYDLVRETVHRASDNEPLIIPEEAVVVAGSRTITSGKGQECGISLYTPVIVKHRDAKTDSKIQLEDLLR